MDDTSQNWEQVQKFGNLTKDSIWKHIIVRKQRDCIWKYEENELVIMRKEYFDYQSEVIGLNAAVSLVKLVL